MRPTKLVIQGLTAYKQQVEVDFTELDLFAITGPTGAGKSSLVDAITFALFGQAPRVGRSVKELISQGEDRLKVSLEFASNGSRFRIHRSTARKGQAPVQLERWDDVTDDWARITDRSAEATKEIEDALRMDYDAFVRSVLLPQGQFQEFLSGDRDERRKVLDGLLQLGVYAAMQQRANALAARHSEDGDRIRERLETELRDATPEALREATARLAELEKAVGDLAKTRETIEAAVRMADGLAEARARERETRTALAAAEEGLTRAKGLASGGEAALKALDGEIAGVAAEMAGTQYDSDLHLRYSQCLPLLKEMERVTQREAKLDADIKTASAAVARQVSVARQATERLEAARKAAQAAQVAYDEARHGNAAALLQSKLKAGDACPVCGQKVEHIEKGKSSDRATLDRLSKASETAKTAADKANLAVQESTLALTRTQQQLEGFEGQLVEVRLEHQTRSAELTKLLPEPGLSANDVTARIEALEAGKKRLDALEVKHKGLLDRRQTEANAISGAQDEVRRLETETKTLERQVKDVAAQAEHSLSALRAGVHAEGWSDAEAAIESLRETSTRAQDERIGELLRGRLSSAQAEEARSREEIGAQRTRIEVVQRDIETAKELRTKEKEHRDAATLARDLASLLKTDRFPTFIRERALQTLAREGSRQLEEISGGRYDFEVEGQDFLIVDRWNGGETRSVKTLSGGETFLASLALALALAEHLPSLATSGGESALESLFIDEGFSHLDADTLNTVASALEVLGQDRRRLIGVVTHVPALAERMPARIVVHKSQAGSTVSVE